MRNTLTSITWTSSVQKQILPAESAEGGDYPNVFDNAGSRRDFEIFELLCEIFM